MAKLRISDLFYLTRKRLRSVCHSIGKINIILFLYRLVLQQWASSFQQIHSSCLAIKGIKVLHSLKLYYHDQGDMGEERHW